MEPVTTGYCLKICMKGVATLQLWAEFVGIAIAEVPSHDWYFYRNNREDMNELFSNYSGKAGEDILHFILWCRQFDVSITAQLIFLYFRSLFQFLNF